MKIRHIITMIASAFLFSSCMEGSMDAEVPDHIISGTVTMEDGTPIEHIQVTLEWNDLRKKEMMFTSSDGIFKAPAYLSADGETEVTITLTDIDEEENGGTFEESVKKITILEEDIAEPEEAGKPVILELAFHLTHATL